MPPIYLIIKGGFPSILMLNGQEGSRSIVTSFNLNTSYVNVQCLQAIHKLNLIIYRFYSYLNDNFLNPII